jgi:16S rRNA (guanine527-N7)-methyltransferase
VKQPSPPPAPVSRETEEKLRTYLRLLMEWSRRINLVAAAPEEVLWQRHVMDSWQLLPLLPPGPLADLGSGGGLPGIILAIGRADAVHLIESDKRKAAFLREAARVLGLKHVHVHPDRVEAVRIPYLAAVTARALAPMVDLLPHAAKLLAPRGVAVFPKGRNAEAELTAAAPHWFMQTERFASRTDPESTIFRLSEIRPAIA